MATEEFFSQMGGNTNRWLRASFQEIVGHAATSTEIDLWMRRFGELRYSRTELLNQLSMQARGLILRSVRRSNSHIYQISEWIGVVGQNAYDK